MITPSNTADIGHERYKLDRYIQSDFVIWLRKSSDLIVNDRRTQVFITTLIVVNSITMGLATYPFVRENPHISSIFSYIDLSFLIIYTLEFIMHFIHLGLNVFKDGWLVFEFVIVATSWAYESLTVVRAFRVLRAFRIFRAFRLVRRFKPIREVVSAILSVIPNLMNITLLLLLTFYINAVFFTCMFKDMYKNGLTEEDHFSRLDTTSFTLFQIMCIDDWSEIAREVMSVYTWSWAPFVLFLITTTFTMLSMFIAVFCNAFNRLDRDQNETRVSETGLASGAEPFEAIEVEVRELVELLDKLSKMQNETIQGIKNLELETLGKSEQNDKERIILQNDEERKTIKRNELDSNILQHNEQEKIILQHNEQERSILQENEEERNILKNNDWKRNFLQQNEESNIVLKHKKPQENEPEKYICLCN